MGLLDSLESYRAAFESLASSADKMDRLYREDAERTERMIHVLEEILAELRKHE